MKNILALSLLCTTILSTPTNKPIPKMITLKWESSEILTDSEGEAPPSTSNSSNRGSSNRRPSLFNKIPIWKARVKHNYIESNSYEIRQINENSFIILGSTLSRAIDRLENNK